MVAVRGRTQARCHELGVIEPTPLSVSGSPLPALDPRRLPWLTPCSYCLNALAPTDNAGAGDALMHGATSAERGRWAESGLAGSALDPLVPNSGRSQDG